MKMIKLNLQNPSQIVIELHFWNKILQLAITEYAKSAFSGFVTLKGFNYIRRGRGAGQVAAKTGQS